MRAPHTYNSPFDATIRDVYNDLASAVGTALDLVFVSMGFTATGCLRIALQRPRDSDRDAMIDHAAGMLAASLAPART